MKNLIILLLITFTAYGAKHLKINAITAKQTYEQLSQEEKELIIALAKDDKKRYVKNKQLQALYKIIKKYEKKHK